MSMQMASRKIDISRFKARSYDPGTIPPSIPSPSPPASVVLQQIVSRACDVIKTATRRRRAINVHHYWNNGAGFTMY